MAEESIKDPLFVEPVSPVPSVLAQWLDKDDLEADTDKDDAEKEEYEFAKSELFNAMADYFIKYHADVITKAHLTEQFAVVKAFETREDEKEHGAKAEESKPAEEKKREVPVTREPLKEQ